MAKIQLKNIVKSWGTSVGVKRMSLDIADGEFLVLLGPSGCGKTTTMRMVAGLEDPTEGEIWIGDNCVNALEPKDRDVAMVFQSYGLYPNMTVYENISFPLRIRGVPKSEIHPAVMKASGKVELDEFLQRKPKELSGGQRQRVALARAIVREPKVFLMDEPLSNLDAKLRVSMRAHIKHLHHELGVTTIYVTHDQVEAMTLADRVVVMSKAEIQQVGTPEEIYNDPTNLFVAVEPKAGQRTVSVTERRGKADFVVFVGDLLTHTYAKARRVHLVLDNLNIHFRRCFDDVLGKRAANKLLRRVQFHYTPKHASWLNWRRSRSVSSVVNVWTGELKAETACNARLTPGSRPVTSHSEPSGGRSPVRTQIRSSVDITFRNLRVDALGPPTDP